MPPPTAPVASGERGEDVIVPGLDAGPADPALQVWALFLRAHALVRHLLAARLARNSRVPLADLEVLLQLEAIPDGRLRMAVLAERVLLSRSGLTRRIERLERLGLVERQACPHDARGAFAVLTVTGRALGVEAAADHLAGVRQAFEDPLIAARGLQPLRAALQALIAAAEAQITGAGLSGPAAVADGGTGQALRYTDADG